MPYSDRFKITEEERKRIENDELYRHMVQSSEPSSKGSEALSSLEARARLQRREQYAEMERARFSDINNPNAICLWKEYKEEQDAIVSGPEAHRIYLNRKAAEKAAREEGCRSKLHFGI